MNGEVIRQAFNGVDDKYKQILVRDNKELLMKTIDSLNENISFDTTLLAPSPSLIFNAFKLCKWDDLRVVIIGQDPYPTPGNAMGMSFSVNRDVAIPDSLHAIYTCLIKQGLMRTKPSHGDLTYWATQGVLLLNAALTTKLGVRAAHSNIWLAYTNKIIEDLCKAVDHPLVFILWGGEAKKKAEMIREPHITLSWGHPSPISMYNKRDCPQNFVNCSNFKECNRRLIELGMKEIDWDINNSDGETTELVVNANDVIIATDGGCVGMKKGGCPKAAWAYCIVDDPESIYELAESTNMHELVGKSLTEAICEDIDCKEDSGILDGDTATNNRGELTAIQNALAALNTEDTRNVIILSDSEYSINAIDNWSRKWVNNNELEGKLNLDIILPAQKAVDKLRETRHVNFIHIRSHKKQPEDKSLFLFWYLNYRVDAMCSQLLA